MENLKIYKTTISPISNFATPLKGDTLFGQMCWGIFYTQGKNRLKELLSTHKKTPFLIASDGFAKGFLPKPKIPSHLLRENLEDKKKNRKKIWLKIEELKQGEFQKALDPRELNLQDKENIIIRNSLDYMEFHTKKGHFGPYGERELFLREKDIYFLIDENKFSFEELYKAFKFISEIGYGKDTTIGKGRFKFSSFKNVTSIFLAKSKYFMSLSPFSPHKMDIENIYYEPFTRFGKFGLERAYKNAFKRPILLADTASVVEFRKQIDNPLYFGKSIEGISKIYKDTLHQGYSISIPIGVNNE